MWGLVHVFLDIALHRRGPEHLPASQFFFYLVLAVSLCIGVVSLLFEQTLVRSVTVTAVTTIMDFAFFWAVLKSFARERRFVQTMTALLGTNAFLNVLILPLAYWANASGGADSDVVLPFILIYALAIWWVDIGGFVLARAVDRPYALGVAIMLGYVLLSFSLQTSMFPPDTA